MVGVEIGPVAAPGLPGGVLEGRGVPAQSRRSGPTHGVGRYRAAGAPRDAVGQAGGSTFSYAAGSGLSEGLTDGTGKRGGVTGGRAVTFKTPAIRQYAQEIAQDEKQHVEFLRQALGGAKVSRPTINLDASFTGAAMAAGLIKAGEKFDPYANEQNFLLAAFIFEDVGVTAYKGAAPLISNKTYLSAAAGILAAEAYHAGLIRTSLYNMGLQDPAGKISDARDSLDGPSDLDQGISLNGGSNIVPLDANGIAFGRTPGQVLNVVYLAPKAVTKGGFFPDGVNGALNKSGGGLAMAGAGTTPTGGAATGAGGTAEGGNPEMLVGGIVAAAAAGAVAAAGAYQHSKKSSTKSVSEDVATV